MNFTHIANPVRVEAMRIKSVTDVTTRAPGTGQTSPDLSIVLEDGRQYHAGSEMTARYIPRPGDYLVRQEDGYEYLNPREVFERKYSTIPQEGNDVVPIES